MNTFLTIGLAFAGIGALIFFSVVIFARNRAKAILSQGQKIYFDGEPRKVVEVLTYDHNKETDKLALLLNDPARWGHIYKTGFIYSPQDFDPNPIELDWRSYFGVIKCFKNEDGLNDGRELGLKQAHKMIQKLNAENQTHKRMLHQASREYSLENINEERKEETFHKAGVLRDLKKLTHDPEIINKGESNIMKKLINQ